VSVDERASGPSKPKIFLSYRVGDSDFAAALIYSRLSERFGSSAVFQVGHSIDTGADFRTALTEAARSSRVMLVLIGPTWLSTTDEHGIRRIDRKVDWVRREIEAATQAGSWIIPVLLPGARPMASKDLPPSLATLATRQALRLNPADVDSTLERLIAVIAQLTDETAGSVEPEEKTPDAPSGAELVAEITESSSASGGGQPPSSGRIHRNPVPDGPIREFFDRLHELHRWAGEPSTRTIARRVGGVISHVTIHAAFRGPRVPRWGHVELIVEALGGDIDIFRRAWVRARDEEDRVA
jgi:TIR domain